MQLDRVRRDTRLAVLVVKERDTGHAGPRAEPYAAAGDADLTAPERRRPRVALGRGRLRDHVVAALLEHEVQVAVLLGTDEHHRGDDREDAPLERQTRVRQRARRRPRDEVADRRLSRGQEVRPVLERLHRPALDAAGPPLGVERARLVAPAPDEASAAATATALTTTPSAVHSATR